MLAWFDDLDDPRALTLHGRRRVGKSWLFRAFAHGRDADIFVADTRATADQLAGFAALLERDGERPALPDLESFFRILYRRARSERRLAIIDELPFLLTAERELPSILMRVMEEEASASRLKLVLAGSHVGVMDGLLAERQPLHDRLRPLRVGPLDFWRARTLLGDGPPDRLLTAFALAGGMPRYLSDLAGAEDPARRLADIALDPHGALFDEPRAILAQELDAPHVYFSLLATLADGPQPWGQIVARSRVASEKVSRYLSTLATLGIVASRVPVTDVGGTTRNRSYALSDGFMRFWFRFVMPYQADLEAGLDREMLFRTEIEPNLAGHVGVALEDVSKDWVRRHGIGSAARVGAWWGPAEHALRRAGKRSSEEIDIVGVAQGRVTVVGEVRWQSQPMDVGILGELDRFKLPALRQVTRVAAKPDVVLVSRSGFTAGLADAAARDRRLHLVGPTALVE